MSELPGRSGLTPPLETGSSGQIRMMRRNISSWMFRKANIPSIDPAIDREISAVSKFSSVIDKNRGYAAADMPAIHREDPRQNLLPKTMIDGKAHRFRSRPMRGGGEFGPC